MWRVNISEAQETLFKLVDAVQSGESVIITRDEKPVAVMISADLTSNIDYKSKINFVDFLMSIPSEINIDQHNE